MTNYSTPPPSKKTLLKGTVYINDWCPMAQPNTVFYKESLRSSWGFKVSSGPALTWLLWMEMAQASLSGSCCRLRWIPPPDLNTQRSVFRTSVTPHRKRTRGSPVETNTLERKPPSPLPPKTRSAALYRNAFALLCSACSTDHVFQTQNQPQRPALRSPAREQHPDSWSASP